MFCYVKYDHCAAREEVHNKTYPGQSCYNNRIGGVGAGKMLNSVSDDPTRADSCKQTIALNR